MLRLETLSYQHPGGNLLFRFTMSAQPGEITAITGPSGSGKSTLLDLVAGFLPPSGGRLIFEDRDLGQLAPEDRPVSIMFQSELLFDHLSVEKNLALGMQKSAAQQERRTAIGTALKEVGLSGTGRQTASTLSGGQKQRAALARTLLRRKPILLLDEPFSALDDQARNEVRQLVVTLTARHHWTTLLVTHHTDDIKTLAARRYRIENGTLVLV